MTTAIRIGVLALQGDFREHESVLRELDVDVVRVRRAEDIARIDGLVLPGGESTVIDRLSRQFGLQRPIRAAIAAGMPVLGTCAGLIMLADRLEDAGNDQESFGGLDVTVRRNAFGGQRESFEADLDVTGFSNGPVRAAFIRGPVIEHVGSAAQPLATLPDGRVVAVAQGNLVGLSFHPEITGEPRFHRNLLTQVAAQREREAGRRSSAV